MKRMTAIVLALALVVCLLPAGVFAVAGDLVIAGIDMEATGYGPGDYTFACDSSNTVTAITKATTGDPVHLSVSYDSGTDTYTLDFNAGGMHLVNNSGDGIYAKGRVIISGTVGNITGGGSGAGISAGDNVTISGTVGKITGGGSGAGIDAVGNVTISGTVKGNITGDYGIYADDGNIDISGTVKGNIIGHFVGIFAEDAGSVTISGTVNGDITGGRNYGIYAHEDVIISGTVEGEISGGRNGIMGGGSVTISGTVNGEIAATDQRYAIAAIMAVSGITITNNDIKVLDDGEEESEIQQYVESAGFHVWTVMAKGKTTPAKKVKLVRSISNTLVPLIPQVNVPVYRLPEYIEAEEVIDEAQPEEVPGDVADVEEGTCDSTIEE